MKRFSKKDFEKYYFDYFEHPKRFFFKLPKRAYISGINPTNLTKWSLVIEGKEIKNAVIFKPFITGINDEFLILEYPLSDDHYRNKPFIYWKSIPVEKIPARRSISQVYAGYWKTKCCSCFCPEEYKVNKNED